DGNLRRHLTLSLEEVDRAENRGTKELLLWKIAHQAVSLAEEHGVAIATERLKYLRKSRRGDGSGRAFRGKQHRFAYASLLRKVHSLARRKGIQVVEVNPQDTSTIGMLKYAPQLSLSKDVAAAYVIGRRALGFREKLPRGYERLLRDERFRGHVQGFYASKVQELRAKKAQERNPYLRRRLSREIGRAKRHLALFSSLQGSPGSQEGSTEGRVTGEARILAPLWRQSLAGPEGRHLQDRPYGPDPSPPWARGAEEPLSPQAHPLRGIVGGVGQP
ncbi:transposase, IS605 OrfB family, central region, partial [Thermus arciformis]